MEGELQDNYFGFIKPSKQDVLDLKSLNLQIYVLPPNFNQLVVLMHTLDDFMQYSKLENNQYKKFKWKHSFDTYKDQLPAYYNDYLNTCLKFVDSKLRGKLKIPQSQINTLLLPDTESVYRQEARLLNELVKQIRKNEATIEFNDEQMFNLSKQEHEAYAFIKSYKQRRSAPLQCCQVAVMPKIKDKSVESHVLGPEELIANFELINSKVNCDLFVDKVVWQLN